MQLKWAKKIVAAAEQDELEVHLHEDYSGRGMNGRTTTGIVGRLSTLIQAIAIVGVEVGSDREEALADDFVKDMDLSMASMGYRDVILY